MNRITLGASLVALALAATAPAASFAKDGVYTSSAIGRNGEINVQVTIQNDKIADIRVLDWSETHPVADGTKTKLIPDIIKYQSLEVNAVSGATLSSFAIKEAVENCLEQAGLKVEAFEKARRFNIKSSALGFVLRLIFVKRSQGRGRFRFEARVLRTLVLEPKGLVRLFRKK